MTHPLRAWRQQNHIPITALAQKLGVTVMAVTRYELGQRRISPERARAIEAATGGSVTKEILRPDIWTSAESERVAS